MRIKKYILDFAGMSTREQIHSHIAGALSLPAHYGRNLDALYDCLSEISEPTCIGVYNIDSSNGYMESLAQVLSDAAGSNPSLCVFFAQKWLNDALEQ